MYKVILIFVIISVPVFLSNLSILDHDEARVLFVGDMGFDRYVRQVVDTRGGDFVFSCIGDFLREADLVVGNLEGPITDNMSVSLGSEVGSPDNFIFTFSTTTALLLSRYNIGLVNLGNNHVGNFGRAGVVSTHNYLEEAGVAYFGGLSGDEPVYRTHLGGAEISFISFNQFGGVSPEVVAEKVREESEKGRLVIVYAHWGNEYVDATDYEKRVAGMFANAGAKAVMGSHPHVISSSEQIGEAVVYYSLGNFIFDQYWNEEVSTGLIVEMNIENGDLSFSEHRVRINRDGRTCLI